MDKPEPISCYMSDARPPCRGTMREGLTTGIVRIHALEFPLIYRAMVCDRCGFSVLTPSQADDYTIASQEQYLVLTGEKCTPWLERNKVLN